MSGEAAQEANEERLMRRGDMNICGVLVHAMPPRVNEVIDALLELDGVEVHQTADGGRIVVTVEDTANTNAIDTLSAIHRLDGVVSAGLAYHHFESADEETAAVEEVSHD